MDTIREGFWDTLFNPGGPLQVIVQALLVNVKSFAGVLILMFIAYKVVLYLADVNSKLDPFVIIKPLLIIGALVLYEELVQLLVFDPIDILDLMVQESIVATGLMPSVGTGGLNALFGTFQTALTYVPPEIGTVAGVLGGTPAGAGVYDIIALSEFLENIHLLVYFIASAVGAYIMFRQVVIAAIYYVLGVFAVPFSLVIGNQSVLGGWFFGFLGIMLWLPILRVMMAIISGLDIASVGWSNAIFSIALQFVFIISILQVPSYANILVTKGSEIGSSVGTGLGNAAQGGLKKGAGALMKGGKK